MEISAYQQVPIGSPSFSEVPALQFRRDLAGIGEKTLYIYIYTYTHICIYIYICGKNEDEGALFEDIFKLTLELSYSRNSYTQKTLKDPLTETPEETVIVTPSRTLTLKPKTLEENRNPKP